MSESLVVNFFRLLALFGSLAACAYYLISIYAARHFARSLHKQVKTPAFMPPVSILKPLCGTDPHAYENLRSHCLQDYPEYEIIFGVSDPQDVAIGLVNQIMAEFPDRHLRLVI